MSKLALPKPFHRTAVYDLSVPYSRFVPFTVNSGYPIHRWYKFKEGFSKDLVNLVIGSLGSKIRVCLDPFAGSGTTPLTCQYLGLECYSIEVNPFMHQVSKAKLSTRYTVEGFRKAVTKVKRVIGKKLKEEFHVPVMSTLAKRANSEQWLFSPPAMHAILALRSSFKVLGQPYSSLFLVVLASILPDIGNTFKDGKCVRYKKDWRHHRWTASRVVDLFFKQCQIFAADINYIAECKPFVVNNGPLCYQDSALEALNTFRTNSIDAVITSPPYLNSFDYTDVYMPELWALGFVNSYEDVRRLREKTLCSHVQFKWQLEKNQFGPTITKLVREVVGNGDEMWNSIIPDMIAGYFLDLRRVLLQLSRIIRPNGYLCIVIGTSSYNGVVIPTDLILAGIAHDLGFHFEEMRISRNLKGSTKQASISGSLPRLRESILIFSKSNKTVRVPSRSFTFPKGLI